jgi:hypothetical protein
MSDRAKKAVLRACRQFLKPVARLLIKNGIGFREFCEIAKTSFVEVASDDYGIRGRKTNMSRVAVMTGLSRKEVKKIRDAIAGGELVGVSRNRRPELLLMLWHTAPEFMDQKGLPKLVPFDGDSLSFVSLVDRAGGDIPPKAMLNELLRAGSVVREGDKLRAVSQSYIPEPNDPEAILLGGESMRHLAYTINFNLECKDPEHRFFERRVYSDRLPTAQRARFKKLAREKSDLLLRDLHTWLGERNLGSEEPIAGQTYPKIGVGVYFFDDALVPDETEKVEK